MKRLAFILLLGPLIPLPALAFTTVNSPSAYMVENTTGTDPSGNACYDFQTSPTCRTFINGLSSSTISPGSTNYIQNSATPTTATQVFKVSSGTIATMDCTTCTLRTVYDSTGSSGTVNQVFTSKAGGTQWTTSSASAGGSPTQIQYNSGGSLAGLPSNVTASSVTISTPVAILGSPAGNPAAPGYYGEVLSSATVSDFVALTNTQYADLATLTITSGTWLLIGQCQYDDGSITSTLARCGISTTSGNSSTGLVLGSTEFAWTPQSGSVRGGGFASFPIAISATTTYFLKGRVDFSAGSANGFGRLMALRIN